MRIPNSWADVPLKKYIEIVEIATVDMDELDKQIKILSVLTDRPEEDFISLSLSDLKRCIATIQFIKVLDCPPGVPTSVKLNGETFEINSNVRKLTGGEYISLCEWTKDKGQINKNLPDILSLFLKPKDKSFYYKNSKGEMVQTMDSLTRNAQIAKDYLTMDKVIQMSTFFLRSWISLTEVSHNYLMSQQKKRLDKVKKDLKRTFRDLFRFGGGSIR